MKRMVLIVAVLSFSGLLQAAIAAESRTTEESKGLTVDDLGRGLKSAAKNVRIANGIAHKKTSWNERTKASRMACMTFGCM